MTGELNGNYFPFQPVPQKKSAENRTRKSDLEVLVPVSPASGQGQALKPSKSPRGPGEPGAGGPTTDPTPGERRVPGPTRAVPRLALLRLCRPHGPYASHFPPGNSGRQAHLQTKAQTPAPAKTSKQTDAPRTGTTILAWAFPCSPERERFMECVDYFSHNAPRDRRPVVRSIMGNVVLSPGDLGESRWEGSSCFPVSSWVRGSAGPFGQPATHSVTF